MIELVVFDMAGTTVHDEDGVNRCIRGALQTFGLAAAVTQPGFPSSAVTSG